MRIAHFVHHFNADHDHVRSVIGLCEELASKGHGVAVFTAAAFDVPMSWRGGKPGMPRVHEIAPLGGRLKLQTRWSRRFLQSHLAGMDALHIHGAWTSAEAQVAAIARRLEVPCVRDAVGEQTTSEQAESMYAAAMEGSDLATAAYRLAASA